MILFFFFPKIRSKKNFLFRVFLDMFWDCLWYQLIYFMFLKDIFQVLFSSFFHFRALKDSRFIFMELMKADFYVIRGIVWWNLYRFTCFDMMLNKDLLGFNGDLWWNVWFSWFWRENVYFNGNLCLLAGMKCKEEILIMNYILRVWSASIVNDAVILTVYENVFKNITLQKGINCHMNQSGNNSLKILPNNSINQIPEKQILLLFIFKWKTLNENLIKIPSKKWISQKGLSRINGSQSISILIKYKMVKWATIIHVKI